jgi:hypothetical protein
VNVLAADAGGAVRVATGSLAVWSPDSRELAYTSVGHIAVVRADGRKRSTITRSYVDILDVEWRR